ncbi:hypothetical protein SDRG_07375 [Saprolegnia diclina VS20]|uniref:Plastocyanin-like domain-containing protein n=1 Tax=Saprolegnia diclina (strain VS20) TaxID=1156394 RepID=T0RXR6_SAPDV|nr:hypothetical protein SDRG_07375 [Saprolegnia diclina VS20]EQC35142.1 hypothetical protein SDRG_07375 [Saprolegnia diclina VS20]|eukprot:XP_008611426.1 hypothetical protein SDRG_07375 [Saprolegnia diclina VS20]
MYGAIEISERKDPFRVFLALLSALCVGTLYVLYPHLDLAAYNTPVVQNFTSASLLALARDLPPLPSPPVYKSHNGVLEITLTVQATRFTNGPVAFTTRSYNGLFPGPTLCAKPGDTLRITLINQLEADAPSEGLHMNTLRDPNTTNIHFHGMHVSPSGVADNVLRALKPGESMEVIVKIPNDHPLGVYHYHPHHHGSVFLQMGGGMVGAISIQDSVDEVDNVLVLQAYGFKGGMLGNLIGAANVSKSTLPMDVQLTNMSHKRVSDAFPDYQPRFSAPATSYPSFYTVNGQYHPRMTLLDGERKLFRLINAGPTQILELSVPGCDVEVFAKDVFPPAETKPEFIIVSPGARVAFTVQCHLHGRPMGLFPFVSSPHSKSAAYMGRLTDVYHGVLGVFDVRATSASVPALTLPRSNTLRDLRGITESDETIERFHVSFSSGPPAVRDGATYKTYYMNGMLFDPTVRYQMKLGQLYEWTLENVLSSEEKNHPFHIHTNPFQIVSASHGNGLDHSIGDWRDTITLPFGGNVTIRFRPVDFTGLIAAHCHILGHSDAGMLMLIEIQP